MSLHCTENHAPTSIKVTDAKDKDKTIRTAKWILAKTYLQLLIHAMNNYCQRTHLLWLTPLFTLLRSLVIIRHMHQTEWGGNHIHSLQYVKTLLLLVLQLPNSMGKFSPPSLPIATWHIQDYDHITRQPNLTQQLATCHFYAVMPHLSILLYVISTYAMHCIM